MSGCETCDGTGCPCMRWRDWQSMEFGCDRTGCGECERNTCRPVSVPAGSSRNPAEEALDRLESQLGGVWRQDLATVRAELERLTEERDGARHNVQALITEADGWRARAESANAEVSRLTAELQHTREGLRRAVYLGEHLHQMIPREVWRVHGAEWMGQYEGDYHAEQVQDELASLALARLDSGAAEEDA